MHKSDEPSEVDAVEAPSASHSALAESSTIALCAGRVIGSNEEDWASDEAVSAHCACDHSCAELTFATLAARPEHARTEGMCCDGTDDYKLAEMPGAKKT